MRKESSVPTPNPLNENHFQPCRTTTADPAAGAPATIARPAASHVLLQHLTFTLVTDANAANRLVWLSLNDLIITLPLGSSCSPHQANATWRYIASPIPLLNMAGALYFRYVPLPPIRSFAKMDTWHINVENIQAGDQISDIYASFRLWHGLF